MFTFSRLSGVALALSVAVAAASPAAASAQTYSKSVPLSCIADPGGLNFADAASLNVIVTAPSSVTPGSTFAPTVQVGLVLDQSIYGGLTLLGAASVKATVTAALVDATGASPGTLNWFSSDPSITFTTANPPADPLVPATPLSVPPYTVTGAVGSSVVLSVDGAPGYTGSTSSPTVTGAGATATIDTFDSGGNHQKTFPIVCNAPSPAEAVVTIPITDTPVVTPPPPVVNTPATKPQLLLVKTENTRVAAVLSCPAGERPCAAASGLLTAAERVDGRIKTVSVGAATVTPVAGAHTSLYIALNAAAIRVLHTLHTLRTRLSISTYGEVLMKKTIVFSTRHTVRAAHP
jgi:hypothetical protein